MIRKSQLETLKEFAGMQLELLPGGAMYAVVEGNVISWTVQSQNFGMEVFRTGMTISQNGGAAQAMREKKTIVSRLPSSVYGKRMVVTSSPVYDDDGKNVVGAVSIGFPRQHPMVHAFPVFAPVLAGMFPEGVYIYVTNLTEIVCHQGSSMFDLRDRHTGYVLTEADVAAKVIRENRPMSFEVDASRYGVPVYITTLPLYDEDNRHEPVGAFGMVLPKSTAGKLRELSHKVSEAMTQISAAVEELAASASEIYGNEQGLSKGLSHIRTSSEEIGEVSSFIRDIANQINMLGLNAAIEAARAGESGRGFTIVAQEIRKLAETSRETVPRISRLTDAIRTTSEDMSGFGSKSIQASQEQAAATQEISASIQDLVHLCGTLNDLADRV